MFLSKNYYYGFGRKQCGENFHHSPRMGLSSDTHLAWGYLQRFAPRGSEDHRWPSAPSCVYFRWPYSPTSELRDRVISGDYGAVARAFFAAIMSIPPRIVIQSPLEPPTEICEVHHKM